MKNINERNYPNIDEAVAFMIDFVPMIYTYDSIAPIEFYNEICEKCGLCEQNTEYLAPKSSMKKEYGQLCSIGEYAVSVRIKNELCERFDISNEDFIPVKTKRGEIFAYQIAPKKVMRPLSEANRVRTLLPCKHCGSFQHRIHEYKNAKGNHYFYITEEMLESVGDMARSVERFHMYLPEYIVSRRVYEYLISEDRSMRFRPLFLKRSKDSLTKEEAQ